MLDYISVINRKLRKIFIFFLKISFIAIQTRLYSQSKWINTQRSVFRSLKICFFSKKSVNLWLS